MTTPSERTRAVNEAGRAIMAFAPYLHGKTDTVRIPRALIRELHHWLRHYPTPFELDMTAQRAPELWAESEPRS